MSTGVFILVELAIMFGGGYAITASPLSAQAKQLLYFGDAAAVIFMAFNQFGLHLF